MPRDLGELLDSASRTIAVTGEMTSHDAWFRSKVKEALNDQQAATPHSNVMNLVQAVIDEKRRQQS